MKIKLEMQQPIPSLPVDKLRYDKDKKKWYYIYYFTSDAQLFKGKKLKEPLYLDGGFVGKKLTKVNKPNMINIRINCFEDLLELAERQIESDIRFREQYLASLDEEPTPSMITLKNKTISFSNEAYIVREYIKDKDSTIFVGRYV